MKIEVSEREFHTILAAVRHWQCIREREIGSAHLNIATNGGEVERLNDEEIDELCGRLNTEGMDDGKQA